MGSSRDYGFILRSTKWGQIVAAVAGVIAGRFSAVISNVLETMPHAMRLSLCFLGCAICTHLYLHVGLEMWESNTRLEVFNKDFWSMIIFSAGLSLMLLAGPQLWSPVSRI